MITIERKVHFKRGRRSRKELREGEAPPSPPPGRVPRVSRLMALAIKFDQLIRDGVVKDQAEIARLGRVSRARVTQVMNLLNLAPSIQEEILLIGPVENGRDPITERSLRSVVAEPDWKRQIRM
ncbi:MAG TPA: hypothetical protein ENJ16_00005, partial [Planctomycetaceae bacterium]|nr:hypothetical protein [Planctomycetaceae bacterium]